MKNFTVRFVDSPGFVSWAITKVTDGLWDHTEFLTPDNKWLGAHSDGGVQARDYGYLVPTRERRYTITLFDSQYSSIQNYGKSKIGTKYDFGDIFGLLLKNRAMNTKGTEICSMFVTECMIAPVMTVTGLQVAGVRPLNVDPDYAYLITPRDLHLSPIWSGHCTYAYPEVPYIDNTKFGL